MAHSPNFNMSDYNRIYDGVRPYFQRDDLTFANLEAPINDDMEYRTYPRFNVQSEYVQAAIQNGVEVFSVANNHINDWGGASIEGTERAFQALQESPQNKQRIIHANGIRRDAQQFIAVQTVMLMNWRVGFVALTQFVNNSDSTARRVQIVDYRSDDQVARLLQEIEAVADQYDLFIVSYHGGAEYETEASAGKRRLFYALAEAGVDIVWGHHPHVLQEWEVYATATEKKSVLMHSLGNFVSGQTWYVPAGNPHHERAPTGDSVIAQVCVRKRGARLEAHRIRTVPISHYKSPDGGVEVRLYRDLVRGHGITEEWHPYYRSRYAILRRQYRIEVAE